MLMLLRAESLEDCDIVGVWYGLPEPNSVARLTLLPDRKSFLERFKLIPRGGGLDRSGPVTEGRRCLGGEVVAKLSGFRGWPSGPTLEGLRRPRAPMPGSEGLLGRDLVSGPCIGNV